MRSVEQPALLRNNADLIRVFRGYTYWLSRTSGGFTSHRCGCVMLLTSVIHNLTLGFVVPGYNTEQADTCNVQVFFFI
jgi:hypothetical protein